MGDLYSDNYLQTFKYLNIFSPLKYIYFLESIIIKNIEEKIFSSFDKVLLFSKKEVKSIKKIYHNKIFQVNESVEKINKKAKFSTKKPNILFIGNLNYLPNILAVKDFAKNILPSLIKKNSNIKFCIIGNIKNLDKYFLSRNKNIIFLGHKKILRNMSTNLFVE